MQVEIERKFLSVDHDKLRGALKAAGAVCASPERRMRRKIFDYPDEHLHLQQHSWVRVRDEGGKITVSFKQQKGAGLHDTSELTFTVSSFDDASEFLERIGMKQLAYQETTRETWELDGCEIDLDVWPWIPPFVEVEAPSEESLTAAAAKLGLHSHTAVHGAVEAAYQAYYDITALQINTCPEITFGPVPQWLESKRRPQPEVA